MLISELVRATSVPLATVKYYLREGLLPAGRKLTERSAEYDEHHLRRLRLLRMLREIGGIPVGRLRDLVEATEDTSLSVHTMFGRAADAIAPTPPDVGDRTARLGQVADTLLVSMGWTDVRPEAVDRRNLVAVLAALEDTTTYDGAPEVLRGYADLADQLAQMEIAALDETQDRITLLESMVAGSVVFERLLTVLRRLAEEHHSHQRFADRY